MAAACEIVENHPQVLSVVLYGSVAKGEAGEESDVDLLVVSEEPLELSKDEYELSMKYGVAFEITTLPLTEFLAVLHLRSSLLFGILEGCDVLFDRSGVAAMLGVLAREIPRDWRYRRDEGVWLRLKR
ncbi:MAG: nucleotidyltransferase domain-containing protein [Candidatus Freyarchaeota archaeon]